MLKTAFWISTVCVLSSFARPQIQQQQQQENIQPENELPEIQKKDIQISKFHVNTTIQMRYGIQGCQLRGWGAVFGSIEGASAGYSRLPIKRVGPNKRVGWKMKKIGPNK